MNKRAFFINAFQKTRSSYWFLPTVLVLLTLIAAQLTLYVDRSPSSVFYIWPDGWQKTEVDGARATLSVIAQSVLGVVGVMFSVTIVAVSFASGNFGPRLIGNFMRDRGTQWSLGILISTFVYALLILRSVQSADSSESAAFEAFVPHFSLGFAIAMMGVSIMTVIFYVHHIPETINVSNITADLGRKLNTSIKGIIDDHADQDGSDHPKQDRDADLTICLKSNGYIQTFDKSRLVEIAEDHDLHIHITQDVGAFVNIYVPVMEIWKKDDLDDDLRNELRNCFVVGSDLTEEQNLLFVVQQLVEMIARALSPGVNDPYTAINCLNWLYSGLSTASNYEGGLRQTATQRVWSESLSFADVFQYGIERAYPYIQTDVLTHQHLERILGQLDNEISHEDDKKTIQKFLKNMNISR